MSAPSARHKFLRFLAETFIEASRPGAKRRSSCEFLRFLAETFIEALRAGDVLLVDEFLRFLAETFIEASSHQS